MMAIPATTKMLC